jgi:hypothetical protein
VGLSREDVLAALTDAAIEAYEDAAEFYSPDQARDWRGRWTSGGGEGAAPVPTHAERGQLRQASLQAVREYVRAGGQPSQVENEQLAAHLARLTVQQLHQVKAEHGLKASGKDKTALVVKLVERFRAHRQTQAPAGKRALEEAVKDRPGFHVVREVVGGHAVRHGPTGSQVRADHAGTRFDVLTSGSTLHSSHATAAAAVKAAEASNRFGTGQSTAEQESRARHEAMRKSRERAAQAKPPTPAAAAPMPADRPEFYQDERNIAEKAWARGTRTHDPNVRVLSERQVRNLLLAEGGQFTIHDVDRGTISAAATKTVGLSKLSDGRYVAVRVAPSEKRRRKSVGFSVAGALSPEEAEERAALRRVQSYADRENARLRAVREGVGT